MSHHNLEVLRVHLGNGPRAHMGLSILTEVLNLQQFSIEIYFGL